MSSRLFICMAADAWLKDPVLSYLPDDCYNLADRLAKKTDSDWRLKLSPHDTLHSIRSECFSSGPMLYRRWDARRIDRALQPLLNHAQIAAIPGALRDYAPVLTMAKHGDFVWITIADRLQYHKGDDGRLAPAANNAAQTEMPLLMSVEAPRKRDIPMRLEKRRSKTSTHQGAESTRVLSHGADSEDALSDEDEFLGQLTLYVGMSEVAMNRGLWITYWREDCVACREMLGQAKLWKAEGKRPRTTPAAMLTDEFKRIRDQRSAAA